MPRVARWTASLVASALVTACGGGAAGTSFPSLEPGTLLDKPGGAGAYLLDEHRAGEATRLTLVEVVWGRLVDVHDVDESGVPGREPIFRDFVVGENVQTDGTDYLLETNALTGTTRLVVRRTRGAPDRGGGTFATLLRAASERLPPVVPRHDDGTSPGPFSFVTRNACLVLRFDDVLRDTPGDAAVLADNVRVLTGYPPDTPFPARVLFDPNHGAVVDGEFHSTRVLVDVTVSEVEAVASPTPLALNAVGLPSSSTATPAPNVSLRLPTRTSVGAGQTTLLRSLRGGPLAEIGNGPVDDDAPTYDVVRALRSGNRQDANNGFLLDLNAPELVGSWGARLSNARQDADGLPGRDFRVDVEFSTSCAAKLEAGDVLAVGGRQFEVRAESVPPDARGVVPNVALTVVGPAPVGTPAQLLGAASYLSTFDPVVAVAPACWITFVPPPSAPPAAGVSTTAQATVRFSEPMLPTSVTPFETFVLGRGIAGPNPPAAEDVVVGNVTGNAELTRFTFTPLLPLAHEPGASELYQVRLGDVVDLAGNRTAGTLAPVEFTLDRDAPEERNGGVVLRFSDRDEVAPVDPNSSALDDLRGQVFYDFDRGVLQPRPVVFSSHTVDRNHPVPGIMTPFPPGVQTPLSRLGSKLQVAWRYVDVGWSVVDETKYNVDVVGLNWAPVGGVVSNDYFEQFEIRLAHSRFLPDEALNVGRTPRMPGSGLALGPEPFANNVLVDPHSPQVVVHERDLGYAVDPALLFTASSGTRMMPFPLNLGGGPLKSYTWRDTAVLAVGGPKGVGVPLWIEGGPPLNLVPKFGTSYAENEVRSVGLPLLMEYRCYPSSTGIGLNPFDISLAANSAPTPHFRAFSTGGVDQSGALAFVNPDLEPIPQGGYNPNSNPPGKRTRSADNSLYIGQVDVVIRVSRAHTVWIDSRFDAPRYLPPVTTPTGAEQPRGTRVVVDVRGARGFGPNAFARAFDARSIGPYGYVLDRVAEPPVELRVDYVPDATDDRWWSALSAIDGARWFQLRLSFFNDVGGGVNAELSGLGVAFRED